MTEALGDLKVIEHDRYVAKVVEEADAIAQQKRHQVHPDHVQQAQVKTLLSDGRGGDGDDYRLYPGSGASRRKSTTTKPLGFLSMVAVSAESKGDDWLCEVSVDHARQRTRHTVTVRRADLERWAAGTQREDVERLVSQSFDFLLEREPPNAILATFDLSVIWRYFPEYDAAFRR